MYSIIALSHHFRSVADSRGLLYLIEPAQFGERNRGATHSGGLRRAAFKVAQRRRHDLARTRARDSQIAEIKFLRSLNHPQLPNLADRLNAQKSSSARSRRKANSASPAIADSSRAYYRTLNTLTKLQAARQKQTQASGPQEERPP